MLMSGIIAGFSEQAKKAGYITKDGKGDWFTAMAVIQANQGKLIPKSELSPTELNDIKAAAQKFLETTTPPDDMFFKRPNNE